MSYWTIEEVADHLGISVQKVYETRRRKEWPGIVGFQQGKRLRFPQDQVEAGPQEPTTTENGTEAILWALEGIHTTLRVMQRDIAKQYTVSLDEALERLGYTREEIENYDEREADND